MHTLEELVNRHVSNIVNGTTEFKHSRETLRRWAERALEVGYVDLSWYLNAKLDAALGKHYDERVDIDAAEETAKAYKNKLLAA